MLRTRANNERKRGFLIVVDDGHGTERYVFCSLLSSERGGEAKLGGCNFMQYVE